MPQPVFTRTPYSPPRVSSRIWGQTAPPTQIRSSPSSLPPLRRSFGLDDLRPELAAAGIDATIVVQTVGVRAETEELLALAAADPLIAGVVGWVDLTSADAGADLDRLLAGVGGETLVGIRNGAQDEPDPRWLLRPDVITGLRAVADFEYEYQMAGMNQQLNPNIETIFLMADVSLQPIATKLVKEIAMFGGDIANFVSAAVRDDVIARIDQVGRQGEY